jgi:hypothetical protein
MPYQVRPVDGGFKVINTETGKAASTRPQTKAVAMQQFRVLEMIEHGGTPDRDKQE